MAKSLEWEQHLFCNGEIFSKEDDWHTPNTYNANFRRPPKSSGVYVFVVFVGPTDLGNVVYIGSSSNLEARYAGHAVKAALYEQYWYVRFYFKECENYKEVEKNLIKKFRPKYNIQHKGNRSLNSRSINLINGTNG